MKTISFKLLLLLLLMNISVYNAYSSPVSEDQAISIADTWYAMELNSGYLKIDSAERINRLRDIHLHRIQYMVSPLEIRDYLLTGEVPLVYIISYQPTGFVVVAGEDRILPVIAYDATTEFRWDHPEENFMHHYLSTRVPAYYQYMEETEHPMWSWIIAKSNENPEKVTFDDNSDDRSIYVLWTTPLWHQGTYYNEVVIANNGGTAGIPTGCTATAMAMKMRFHEWPNTGNSSHSYNDMSGSVQYPHSVNYGSQSYSWSLMPMTSLTSINTHVENLMYHCGVAVDMNYEVGGSGAWPSASSMNTYFRYEGAINIWTPTAYATAMQTSIRGGLPVITSSSAHTVLADGYRDTPYPYFHLNCGWNGGSNGWYDLDINFPGGDPAINYSMPYCQPQNYEYVDGSYSGTENGKILTPYNTLTEGYTATPVNGELWIKAGTYSGASNHGTLDKAMDVKVYEGGVVIQ